MRGEIRIDRGWFHAKREAASLPFRQGARKGKPKASALTVLACGSPCSSIENQIPLLKRDRRAVVPDTEAIGQQAEPNDATRWAVAERVFEEVGNNFSDGAVLRGLMNPLRPMFRALFRPLPGAIFSAIAQIMDN